MSRQRARVAPLVLEQGRRTFCVSDIHGNLPLLKGLLDKLAFSQDDTLIVMGDIVERNTGSLATLRYLMALSETHDLRFLLGSCANLWTKAASCWTIFLSGGSAIWGREASLCKWPRRRTCR